MKKPTMQNPRGERVVSKQAAEAMGCRCSARAAQIEAVPAADGLVPSRRGVAMQSASAQEELES
jgi:hypothetical protein